MSSGEALHLVYPVGMDPQIVKTLSGGHTSTDLDAWTVAMTSRAPGQLKTVPTVYIGDFREAPLITKGWMESVVRREEAVLLGGAAWWSPGTLSNVAGRPLAVKALLFALLPPRGAIRDVSWLTRSLVGPPPGVASSSPSSVIGYWLGPRAAFAESGSGGGPSGLAGGLNRWVAGAVQPAKEVAATKTAVMKLVGAPRVLVCLSGIMARGAPAARNSFEDLFIKPMRRGGWRVTVREINNHCTPLDGRAVVAGDVPRPLGRRETWPQAAIDASEHTAATRAGIGMLSEHARGWGDNIARQLFCDDRAVRVASSGAPWDLFVLANPDHCYDASSPIRIRKMLDAACAGAVAVPRWWSNADRRATALPGTPNGFLAGSVSSVCAVVAARRNILTSPTASAMSGAGQYDHEGLTRMACRQARVPQEPMGLVYVKLRGPASDPRPLALRMSAQHGGCHPDATARVLASLQRKARPKVEGGRSAGAGGKASSLISFAD